MQTTQSLAAPAASHDGLAGRKFSKAKSVAARLGICSRTVFRWANAGKIAEFPANVPKVHAHEIDPSFLSDPEHISFAIETGEFEPVRAA